MRPIPRVFAFTDDIICRAADFGVRAAAIASGGSAVALVIKAPASTPEQLLVFASRAVALALPAEASVVVYGSPSVAERAGAHGLHLTLASAGVARAAGACWLGLSAHDQEEAGQAAALRPSYLLAGNVFPSRSDPRIPAHGLAWVRRVSSLGTPLVAVGGITADRVGPVRDAGAWGVAAQNALWAAPDPAKAVMEFLKPWTEV
ncbi:MAG: thiamine phosphate synthase [Gemmatimonadota bacterium]